MDYLQEAKRNYEQNADGLRNLNLVDRAAAIATAEALQSIAVSLAALVELGSNTDFTDKLDEEGELPF